MRASVFATALAASVLLLLPPRDAAACAAAPVSTSGEIGAGAQRILIATRDEVTEVVVEMTVPRTTADYGVLIPVPARPTLDPSPVDSGEIDQVDQATRPQIFDDSASGGGGIGCGSASDRGGLNGLGVDVIEKVNIGPLEVVVLTASAASDLTQWLSSNGFRIPTGKEQVLTRYTGIGNYFIAARRDDRAAAGSPSRIGVHFTLPGTQLTIPLPAVQLGGGGALGITLFVAAEDGVGSMTPYAPLTLNDLDGALLTSDYRGAVQAAVASRNGLAFVVEGIYPNGASSILPDRLASFASPGATLTRMSTVAEPAAFTADLTVAVAGAPAEAPSSRTVGGPAESGCRAARGQASSLAYLLFFAGYWRLRRRSPRA
jgi:hypothetical protein